MAEYLLPLAEAFRRFMPDVIDFQSRTMTYGQADTFEAGVVEGDLVVTASGLAMTNELVPAFKDARVGALFITGSLIAPDATLAEPDIDWSPMLKIKGNVVAKNLVLGGSASEIDGDVTVSGVLMGYYNHGQIRIRGKTRAHVVLVDDYHFIFEGPVERKYVVSGGAEIGIPVDYERDRLDLILVPEVMDETNFLHDGVLLDRLAKGLPILRPENEIGRPPAPRLSVKGAERLADLRARKARGEDVSVVNFGKCELRSIPDELQEFSAARELILSKNRVKTLPGWIGKFESVEVLGLEDCGLSTLPREIAQLPRLRKLDLSDNPITSLPFGPASFRAVEILSIGQNSQPESSEFVRNLDLAQFPWLRVVEQRYDINTVDELDYRESQELWSNPHLEILDIGWPSLKRGIPGGLLRARNLKALATRVNAAQLGSVIWRGPAFEHLEYLAIGYTDLSRADLARLYQGLPRVFISCENIDDRSNYNFPENDRLREIERQVDQRKFADAIAALDEMVASVNLRRPFLPLQLHARLMTACVRTRWIAAQEEQDRGRRQAMAAAALVWADRVLSVLPQNLESLWYLDGHQLWLVRLQCLYARATAFSLRAEPDATAARAALDTAQAELDRFLLPVNPHWHGNESAVINTLRVRIPV